MERALAFRSVPEIGEDIFTNTEPLWSPLWGRGIFGGALIAQYLAIAQKNVPPCLLVHSTHCNFVFPANNKSPILYHVKDIRQGRNSTTRLVEASQSGRTVFIAIISFFHEAALADRQKIQHQVSIPLMTATSKPPSVCGMPVDEKLLSRTCQANRGSLYECVRLPKNYLERQPDLQRLQHWIRTREKLGINESSMISDTCLSKHRNIHLAALAYMSDNYFIGTASRVHHANRFNNKHAMKPVISSLKTRNSSEAEISELVDLAYEEAEENSRVNGASSQRSPNVEMMVSLDHVIYFHNQTEVKADEWMFAEMESPWAGDERAIVIQRIWTRHGVLVATCFQEGAIRLLQDQPQSRI